MADAEKTERDYSGYIITGVIAGFIWLAVGLILGTTKSLPHYIYPSDKLYKGEQCLIVETNSNLDFPFVKDKGRFVRFSEIDKTQKEEDKEAEERVLQDVRNLKAKLDSGKIE